MREDRQVTHTAGTESEFWMLPVQKQYYITEANVMPLSSDSDGSEVVSNL